LKIFPEWAWKHRKLNRDLIIFVRFEERPENELSERIERCGGENDVFKSLRKRAWQFSKSGFYPLQIDRSGNIAWE
jgi:hypothetical protein